MLTAPWLAFVCNDGSSARVHFCSLRHFLGFTKPSQRRFHCDDDGDDSHVHISPNLVSITDNSANASAHVYSYHGADIHGTHTRSHSHTHESSTDALPYADSLTYSHRRAHRGPNSTANLISDTHSHARAHKRAHRYPNSHADCWANCDPDPCAHLEPNSRTDRYADASANVHTNSHTHISSHFSTDCVANICTHRFADCVADICADRFADGRSHESANSDSDSASDDVVLRDRAVQSSARQVRGMSGCADGFSDEEHHCGSSCSSSQPVRPQLLARVRYSQIPTHAFSTYVQVPEH